MATVNNMYDVALKPRLLRAVLRDQVPAETGQSTSILELHRGVAAIKTYRLLSEPEGGTEDKKLVGSWKSAFDAFINRALLLTSSKMPDKCWAGVCLLGLTCKECSSDRFLASYSAWFEKLLVFIQPQGDFNSVFVKVVSCAALSDLLKRLDRFPSLQKDKTLLAGKLIQPILKLLREEPSEAVQEGAVNMLSTLISLCPFAVQRHYDQVEDVICSKIESGRNSISMSERLAHCLAVLPKSRGDGKSWSLLMQRILLFINTHLNDAFQGLEEDAKGTKAVRLLIPPGEDPPCALFKNIKQSEQLWTSIVPTLMLCCFEMLTNSYPFQVAVPIKSLLALAERVLTVDGSISPAIMTSVTSMQQELICSKLPVLHSQGLELLIALTKGMKSQMLPHGAHIMRLVTRYLKMCMFPELRIKSYSVIRMLLITMGVGLGIFLAEEITNIAFEDLNPELESRLMSSNLQSNSTQGLSKRAKKRKRAAAAAGVASASAEAQHLNGSSVGKALENHPKTSPAVKVAALEALEALLSVTGALRSESWRSKVDTMLIYVATEYFDKRWDFEDMRSMNDGCNISSEELQLAALRTLLTSLLSPAPHMSARLAKSLELFRRGTLEIGTKVADVCAHSLFSLEVLSHPRAHPLADYTAPRAMGEVGRKTLESTCFRGPEDGLRVPGGVEATRFDLLDSDDDDIQETEDPVVDQATYSQQGQEPPSSSTGHKIQNLSTDRLPSEKIPTHNETRQKALVSGVGIKEVADVTMVEAEQYEESVDKSEEPQSSKAASNPSERVQDEPRGDKDARLHESVTVNEGNRFSAVGESATAATLNSGKSKALERDTDEDSPGYTFPEIIDVGPESDEE